MKVWVFNYLQYGDVSIWSEDTDVLEIDAIKTELSHLDNEAYEAERDDFIEDVQRALRRGTGYAEIEERVRVELVEVKTR